MKAMLKWDFRRDGELVGSFISSRADAETRQAAADICRFATGKGTKVPAEPYTALVGDFCFLLLDCDGKPVKVWR